jgi:hypothetical protein
VNASDARLNAQRTLGIIRASQNENEMSGLQHYRLG